MQYYGLGLIETASSDDVKQHMQGRDTNWLIRCQHILACRTMADCNKLIKDDVKCQNLSSQYAVQ